MFLSNERPSEKDRFAPRIQALSICALLVTIALSVVALFTVARIFTESRHAEEVRDEHETCSEAADQLMDASDLLTSESRMFVVTHRTAYMNNYLNEYLTDKRRDDALEVIRSHIEDDDAKELLEKAFVESNRLADRELYAMRLAADANGVEPLPETLGSIQVNAEDAALPADEKQALAEAMVLNEEYLQSKELIVQDVNACADEVVRHLRSEEDASNIRLTRLLTNMRYIVYLLTAMVAAMTLLYQVLIVRPMHQYSESIRNDESLHVMGAREMRDLALSYNAMYLENHLRTRILQHEAETDSLTGLLNRGSFDKLLEQESGDYALILIDVDLFKEINDTYGHTIGDEVLKKVANNLVLQFRNTDHACRIGGDEMAVIMTDMVNVNETVIRNKMDAITAELRDGSDGLPRTTLSVGVAFSHNLKADTDIYHAADKALYNAKRNGRNRVSFYHGS